MTQHHQEDGEAPERVLALNTITHAELPSPMGDLIGAPVGVWRSFATVARQNVLAATMRLMIPRADGYQITRIQGLWLPAVMTSVAGRPVARRILDRHGEDDGWDALRIIGCIAPGVEVLVGLSKRLRPHA